MKSHTLNAVTSVANGMTFWSTQCCGALHI